MRTASADGGGEQGGRPAEQGDRPASVWDGLFLRAGELLMRQPGIVGLHCVTSINALHFGYQHASGNDETRRFLLLQAAAFLPMFRETMSSAASFARSLAIDRWKKPRLKGDGAAAVEEIFADVSKDRLRPPARRWRLIEANKRTPRGLITAARRLVFLKGRDSHDYKFSSAALEDYYHASPACAPATWRPACSTCAVPATGTTTW